VSRLLRAAAALVLLAAAGVAVAFVRTTVTKNPASGVCLWWNARQVAYEVNASAFDSPSALAGSCTSSIAAGVVGASLPAWSQATRLGEAAPCTDFKYVGGADSTRKDLGYDRNNPASNVNLVVFRRGLCAQQTTDANCQDPTNGTCIETHNCWSHDALVGAGATIALTTATFVVSTGEILDADIELNGWNGEQPPSAAGLYFTCAEPGPGVTTCPQGAYGGTSCIAWDVKNTVTHEAGHMLGLDHVCENAYPAPYNACPSGSPTMAPTAVLGDITKRTLAPDDVEGVCTIYPAGKAVDRTTACPAAPAPNTAMGCGCGTGGGSGLALLGLVAALRRRRPQRITAPA